MLDVPDQTARGDVRSGTGAMATAPVVSRPGKVEDPRAVLDSLPAVIGYYGADLRNRLANRAYVEFFGVTPG